MKLYKMHANLKLQRFIASCNCSQPAHAAKCCHRTEIVITETRACHLNIDYENKPFSRARTSGRFSVFYKFGFVGTVSIYTALLSGAQSGRIKLGGSPSDTQ